MPVYVCVRYVGHLPVFPEVVTVLLLRFHRPGGEDVDSHFVLPVWSVCVCASCVSGYVSDRALALWFCLRFSAE